MERRDLFRLTAAGVGLVFPQGGQADRGRVGRARCHHAAPDRGDRVRGGDGRRVGLLDRARSPPVSGVSNGQPWVP